MLAIQTMPGGITQHTEYDATGQPTGLTYSGQVGSQSGESWLSWSQGNDALGRVRLESTPAGAAFDGDLTGGGAIGYSRVYSYDQDSRLTRVIDNTAAEPNASTLEDGATPLAATCETRSYAFDINSNRTSLARFGANPDGSCATTGGNIKASTYDSADRLTGGYVYDPFGRVTSMPSADTPAAATSATPGALSLGYYANDSVKSISQSGVTTTYGLDATGRRSTVATGPATGGPATETSQSHYANDSDNPSWTSDSSGASTRYVGSLSDTAATINDAGVVQLNLSNMHGDVVTALTLPNSGNALGIDSWSTSDEFGNTPVDGEETAEPQYGWLGGKQRATDSSGLLLMGARLYNPVTAQFTSPDPVPGGGSTAYAYPTDSVNIFDLDGNMWKWAFNAGWWAVGHVVGLLCGGAAVAYMACHAAVAGIVGGMKYVTYQKYVVHRRVNKRLAVAKGIWAAIKSTPGSFFMHRAEVRMFKAFVGKAAKIMARKFYRLGWVRAAHAVYRFRYLLSAAA